MAPLGPVNQTYEREQGMSLLAKTRGIFNDTLKLFFTMSGLTIIFMMLAVNYEVIMRYFLNRPTIWVLESVEWSLVWMTFLGAAWVLMMGKHVRMDIIFIMMPLKVQVIITVINDVICSIICLTLTWYGTLSTLDHFRRGVVEVKMLEFPKGPLMMVIPAGCLLLFIQYVIITYGDVKDLKVLRGNQQNSQQDL